MTPKDRLIVALDRSSRDEILALADRLAGTAGVLKVGLQAFVANGPDLVREIVARDEKVFLDLKIHDIPNTARHAVAEACALGASIVTVHTSGGTAMLESCAAAATPAMLVAGVTVLTSLDDEALDRIGYGAGSQETVLRLAGLARDAGVRGIVASPMEIEPLRDAFGDALTIITPGIRPAGGGADDQRRTLPAGEAVKRGADYIVVGRPITGAADPAAAASAIVDEMSTSD